MRKKEVQEKINYELSNYANDLGFSLKNKAEGTFVKKFEWGFQNFAVICIRIENEMATIGGSVNLRINVVEDILHRFLSFPKNLHKKNTTIGKSLILLSSADKELFLYASDLDDLETKIQVIRKYINSYGLDYLRYYSELKNSEKYYNTIKNPLNPFDPFRGLILAKLTNSKNFEVLVMFYEEWFQKISSELYKNVFYELVEYLRTDLSIP